MRERYEQRILGTGQCPACGNRTFIGGPQAGLSTNTGCAECDSWWNLTVLNSDVVWVHGRIVRPPNGTRRTPPGPLAEVTRPAPPPLDPDPACPWCKGAGRAPADVFTQTMGEHPYLVDCLCRFLRLPKR